MVSEQDALELHRLEHGVVVPEVKASPPEAQKLQAPHRGPSDLTIRDLRDVNLESNPFLQ